MFIASTRGNSTKSTITQLYFKDKYGVCIVSSRPCWHTQILLSLASKVRSMKHFHICTCTVMSLSIMCCNFTSMSKDTMHVDYPFINSIFRYKEWNYWSKEAWVRFLPRLHATMALCIIWSTTIFITVLGVRVNRTRLSVAILATLVFMVAK